MLKGVSAVDVLLLVPLEHGSNCCCGFLGPRYWWNLITFDLVPIFGRDFFETLPRLRAEDLDIVTVDAIYNDTHFNTYFNTVSMHTMHGL